MGERETERERQRERETERHRERTQTWLNKDINYGLLLTNNLYIWLTFKKRVKPETILFQNAEKEPLIRKRLKTREWGNMKENTFEK